MKRSFFSPFSLRLLESPRDGGEGGTGGLDTAAVNARGNKARLARMQAIGDTADAQRVDQLQDVDHERVVGRFQNGEMDEAPAAKERRARESADLEEEAARELADREEEAERLDQERARSLQEEGGEDERESRRPAPREEQQDEADEKLIDGVRYYRTIVAGAEKWLTLRELREGAGRSATTEETLQRAQDALRSSTQAALTPKDAAAEVEDLENIILSASMGDEEAVRKLASVLKARPTGPNSQDVSRLVAQQIATQREVDRGEAAVADVLGDEKLAPEFRRRLAAFGQAAPNTKIVDAYKAVGEGMRKDFAAMLPKPGTQRTTDSKLDRKRAIINPPASAGRQPARQEEDREVPIGEQIDAIARARGQSRAHRVRRS